MKPLDIRNIETFARTDVVAEDTAPTYGSAVRAPKAPAAALPDYLERHYAWAYVWPFSVWFFDHQPIINAILFGNYKKIMRNTMKYMDLANAGKTLQVAGVYGELTPTLAEGVKELHLIDAAPIQLEAARRKVEAIGKKVHLARMHAENLHYESNSFDTVLLFLLLHEMPPEARRATLSEAIRVVKPGGRVVIAEYGENKGRHFFHWFPIATWILTHAEPFLGGFWKDSLKDVMAACGKTVGKEVKMEEQTDIFAKFYRVCRFSVKE